jgi:hypothetical protein
MEFSITLKELEIFMSEDFGGKSGGADDTTAKDATQDTGSVNETITGSTLNVNMGQR